jgi:basic membrane protein A
MVDGAGTDAQFNDLHHPNVQSLLFHEQDAGALVGVIAGMLEKEQATPKKSNVIGAVGGVSIPPVNHYIAGYKWAAEMEDPGIKVLIDYSNDFNDPTKCKDKANAMIGNNADIIFQVAGGCGLGALQAAGEKGVYSIGVDTDQKSSDASVIASALKRVDVATYNSIKSVIDNLFIGGPLLFTMQNDGVGYAPGNISLPADIQAEVQKISDQIKSGALNVPTDIPTT